MVYFKVIIITKVNEDDKIKLIYLHTQVRLKKTMCPAAEESDLPRVWGQSDLSRAPGMVDIIDEPVTSDDEECLDDLTPLLPATSDLDGPLFVLPSQEIIEKETNKVWGHS